MASRKAKANTLSRERTPEPSETNAKANAFLKGAKTSPVQANPTDGRGLVTTRRRGVVKRMTVYLPAEMARELQVVAATIDEPMSDIITRAIDEHLQTHHR